MNIDLTGQPLIIVLLVAAIGALSTVIIVLWKANTQLQKEKDNLALDRLEDAKEYAEKTVSLTSQTSESVRVLNDVLDRLSSKRRG